MRIVKIIDNDKTKYMELLHIADEQVSMIEKCGFIKSHIAKNFFIDNYDHPIYENGQLLVDMIYLKKVI